VTGAPGRGGVTRGRGDATLEYGGETPGRTDLFEPKVLDPAQYLDPESTAVLGVGTSAPTVAPERGSGGAADGKTSSGQASWKRRVAPHHREAVQSFFGGKKP
jgi:hypothetical protein